MKICFMNPTIEMRRSVAELARKMADNGHEVAMVWPKFRNKELDTSRHFTGILVHKNIKIIEIPCRQVPGLFYSWPIPCRGFVRKIKDILNYYDVVHMWTYFYILHVTPLILRRFRKYKAKVVVTADTFPAFSFRDPSVAVNTAMYLYTKLFGRLIFSSYDKVLIYGDSMIKFALRAGARKKNLKVLPIGLETKMFEKHDAAAVEKVKKEFDIDNETAMILFVGLINPRKGIDTLIRAAKILADRGLKIRVVCAGEEKLKDKYEKMAKELGLEGIVVFPGRRKDIPALMDAADFLILPAKGEGLPGVIMEAAAASKPAVASNTPCIPDLVIDAKTGFLCEIGNAAEFANAAEKLIRNKGLRQRFGRAAHEHIQSYDWKVMLEQYERFYRALLRSE